MLIGVALYDLPDQHHDRMPAQAAQQPLVSSIFPPQKGTIELPMALPLGRRH